MFTNPFVQTDMWDGTKLSVGRAIHPCFVTPTANLLPACFHNHWAGHSWKDWVTFRAKDLPGLNIVDLVVRSPRKAHSWFI